MGIGNFVVDGGITAAQLMVPGFATPGFLIEAGKNFGEGNYFTSALNVAAACGSLLPGGAVVCNAVKFGSMALNVIL